MFKLHNLALFSQMIFSNKNLISTNMIFKLKLVISMRQLANKKLNRNNIDSFLVILPSLWPVINLWPLAAECSSWNLDMGTSTGSTAY